MPAKILPMDQPALPQHALSAKALVLDAEERAQFEQLRRSYVSSLRPANSVQLDLVDAMVSAKWRQRRIWGMEKAALEQRMELQKAELAERYAQLAPHTRIALAFAAEAESRSFRLLHRREQTLTRIYHKAFYTLQRLQSLPPEPAAALRSA